MKQSKYIYLIETLIFQSTSGGKWSFIFIYILLVIMLILKKVEKYKYREFTGREFEND